MERSNWMTDAGYASGVDAERRKSTVMTEDADEGTSWSLLGRAAHLLVPAMLWLLGVAMTQDVKQHITPAPSVNLAAQGLGAFALRMGAIVLAFLCAYSAFFRRPSLRMPRWMTRRDT